MPRAPHIPDGHRRQLDFSAALCLQKTHVIPVRSVGRRQGLDAQGGYGISGPQTGFEWTRGLWNWWAPEMVWMHTAIWRVHNRDGMHIQGD
jgi:hypothetical protein